MSSAPYSSSPAGDPPRLLIAVPRHTLAPPCPDSSHTGGPHSSHAGRENRTHLSLSFDSIPIFGEGERERNSLIHWFNRRSKNNNMVGRGAGTLVGLVFFAVAASAFNLSTLTFDEGYSPLFGDDVGNVVRSADGKTVRLVLNPLSGSGFISSDMYHHGFFSASIKLPSDYTAGIVVAFYTSNADVFEKTHDELDFEFLGNIWGKEWRVQTNIYGNHSTSRGREERYLLPFDPTKEYHRYSILWTAETIIFYIDDTPIREAKRNDAMGGDYPSKPMSLYATIWDASSWATSGGKYKVNYKYGPFAADFTDLILAGRRTDPIQQLPIANVANNDIDLAAIADYAVMTPQKRQAMLEFRERYMTYSNCYDTLRYPVPLPDCNLIPSEQSKFRETGHLRNVIRRQQQKAVKTRRKNSSRSHHKRQADI